MSDYIMYTLYTLAAMGVGGLLSYWWFKTYREPLYEHVASKLTTEMLFYLAVTRLQREARLEGRTLVEEAKSSVSLDGNGMVATAKTEDGMYLSVARVDRSVECRFVGNKEMEERRKRFHDRNFQNATGLCVEEVEEYV